MSKIYKNYFNPQTVAERYLKGRPQYHSFVIEKIKKSLGLKDKFALCLDVGCGTGFSSAALKDLSEKVFGIDISTEMLGSAVGKNKIFYAAAAAENLPFTENIFDLITISQAIHWIDRNLFFAEAGRVLKKQSFIIAYDNYFLGKITDEPDFNIWFNEIFLKKFPTPPRIRKKFETHSENPEDFLLVSEERYENVIGLSKQTLKNYLITITNIINAVEIGGKTIDEIENWFDKELEPFFSDGADKQFVFTAPIWYLRQKKYGKHN